MTVNVGEAVLAALETEGEFLVVNPEKMHQGGMKIMDVNHVLHGVVSEIVRGTV